MSKVILGLYNISFSVKRNGQQQILKSINLDVYQSEIFGLTGESGSGKTTLARIISGLENQTEGKKFFNGKEFSSVHDEHQIQVLFQNYSATHDPLQKIDSSFNEILKLSKKKRDEHFKQKKEILSMLGLSDDVLMLYPNQLSGGQLQRLALAKLLLLNPSLLILDEPFASQDVVSVVNLIKIFKQINEKLKVTILCISHEIPSLLKFCNRIGVMRNGELKDIVFCRREGERIIIENVYSDYTKYLIGSFGIGI